MRRNLLPIAGTLLVVLSAPSLSAQAGAADTVPPATLPTVTVTASAPGNWFTRAHERRRAVVELMEENRRLASVLRRQDAQVARLELRLDSLRRVEAERLIALQALGDSIGAVSARRRALEARIIAAEKRKVPRD